MPASNPNYDLAWEKKAEYNVGIDYGLFDFRLRGSIDYYYRLTSICCIPTLSYAPLRL